MSIIKHIKGLFSNASDAVTSATNSFSTEEGTRIYAIGDIHGYPDALEAMLDKIHADIKERPVQSPIIVFLGDYVDRGPDSERVLELLVQEKALEQRDGIKRVFLTGNHDLAFSGFIINPVGATFNPFTIAALNNGLLETLASYGIDCSLTRTVTGTSLRFSNSNYTIEPSALEAARAKLLGVLPDAHKDFLSKTDFSYGHGGYMFVHAGVDPEKPLDEQDNLYIAGLSSKVRKFPECSAKLDKKIVHGHTISENPLLAPNQIGVDTGVFRHGNLTCTVLEGTEIKFLQTRTNLPAFNPERTYDRFFNPSSSPAFNII